MVRRIFSGLLVVGAAAALAAYGWFTAPPQRWAASAAPYAPHVANGEGIDTPPPSRSRSGWFGTAWQEEHPPALKIISPFTAFGVYGAADADHRGGGAVSQPYTATAAATTIRRPRKIRRTIHPTVIFTHSLWLAGLLLQP